MNEKIIESIWKYLTQLAVYLPTGPGRAYVFPEALAMQRGLEMRFDGDARKVTTFEVYALQSLAILMGDASTESPPVMSVGALCYLSPFLMVQRMK